VLLEMMLLGMMLLGMMLLRMMLLGVVMLGMVLLGMMLLGMVLLEFRRFGSRLLSNPSKYTRSKTVFVLHLSPALTISSPLSGSFSFIFVFGEAES
jgi:hypothetical protein